MTRLKQQSWVRARAREREREKEREDQSEGGELKEESRDKAERKREK